jgi:hypothetical protein
MVAPRRFVASHRRAHRTSSIVSVTTMRWMSMTVCRLRLRPASLPIICAAVPFRPVFADTDTHHNATITTQMVLRVRGALPPQVREAFNASGTVHLPYVSGFYIDAVYGSIFFLLRFLIKQVRYRLVDHVSGGLRPPSKLAATSALAVVMGPASVVALDGLVDLIDPNFPNSRH